MTTSIVIPEIKFEAQISTSHHPYLQDHRVRGKIIFPLTGYIEMALAAASEIFYTVNPVVTKIEVKEALVLSETETRTIKLVISPQSSSRQTTFEILSQHCDFDRQFNQWTLHVKGEIADSFTTGNSLFVSLASLADIQDRCSQPISSAKFYESLRSRGMEHGPSFQGTQQLYCGEGEALGKIQLPPLLEEEANFYQIHPALLDACIQVLALALPSNSSPLVSGVTYLPSYLEKVCIYRPVSIRVWSYACLRPNVEANPDAFEGDVYLFNEFGEVIVEILGLRLQRFEGLVQNAVPSHFKDWLYQLQWKPKPKTTPEKSIKSLASDRPGKWLIFAEKNSALAQELAILLQDRGQTCTIVSPSESYGISSENQQAWMNPERFEDYQQLLNDVCGDRQQPYGVVYLWSLIAETATKTSVASLTASQTLGCQSVLLFLQALSTIEWKYAPKIWLTTRGAQPVTAKLTDMNVAQSLLWGMGKVVALEHPEWFGGLVDLDPEAPVEESSSLFQTIWQPDEEKQLAFRQGQCYVPRLSRQQSFEQPVHSLQWRTDASYLITGGLGDLGLQVARWMVQQGAKNILLLGRTKLPPTSHWNQVETSNHIANRIKAIQELELMGANVLYAAVDIANEAELSSFFKQIQQDGLPPIRGIFHTAAQLHDSTLLKLDTAAFTEVLRPKVLGAWLLHNLLADADLDFFVMFSSAASLLGSLGQTNYTAANAFLDAFSHYRSAQGLPALSINWGAWAEVGMATRTSQAGHFDPRALGSMTNQQGLEVLQYLLQQQIPQVGVLPIDWSQWQKAYPNLNQSPLVAELFSKTLDQLKTTESEALIQEAILAAAPQEQLSLLEDFVHKQVAKVLRVLPSKLDVHLPLNQCGLDSLMAVELKNSLETTLGVAVPLVNFIEGNSIAQLSVQILDQLLATHLKINGQIQAGKILAEIDQLSDSEVNELLMQLTSEEEKQ
ncbi:type I polyketide synthase [Pelatocladus sp. BLCC-F211]|uniref:type I polyketide synthase n=1 Tax=Pelatocladus sp. BLCC-F211 TaxID=3342752 RepID=UPI0035B6D9D4